MEADLSKSSCELCPSAAETTASHCEHCFRPLRRLREAVAFLAPGSLVDVLKVSADDIREPASGATADPLPPPLASDIEAVRDRGLPERGQAGFYRGVPSAQFTEIKRWAFAIPFLAGLVPAFIYTMYVWSLGGKTFVLVFIGGALAAAALGGIGAAIATAITESMQARLVTRCQGNRLLGDRREFVYLCDEGLVWHDGRGLLYVPWDAMDDVECYEDPEKMQTAFQFIDLRTRQRHTIETFGVVGAYSRDDLRKMAAAAEQLAKPNRGKYAERAQVMAADSVDESTAEDASPAKPTSSDRPARELSIRECSQCGMTVVPKPDGTCPSCRQVMG